MAKRKAVLQEEDYTTKLRSIVERDYFPALPSLRRDLAILQARSEGDISKAVAIRRAARLLETHQSLTNESLQEVSVDKFHANVTSEDNAIYDEGQIERLKSQRKMFALTYGGGSASSNEPHDDNDNSSSTVGLLASDDFDSIDEKIAIREERPRNALFFTPQLPPSCSKEDMGTVAKMLKTASEGPQSDGNTTTIAGSHRQMGNEGKKGHDSLLMSPPPPVDMSKRRDKFIQPEQTRFSKQSQSRLVVASFPQHSPHTTTSASDTDTDLDATPLSLNQLRKNEAIKKARECEQFVSMTPLIHPGDVIEDGGGSPIVTWGNVAATPLIVGEKVESHSMENKSSGEKNPAFTMREASFRERAASNAEAKLVKRARDIDVERYSRSSSNTRDVQQNPLKHTPLFPATKSHRSKKSSGRPPSSILERSASLTPAARSLLSKALGGKHIRTPRYALGKVSARDAGSLGSALSMSSRASHKRRESLNWGNKSEASLMKATPRIGDIHTKSLRDSITSEKDSEKNIKIRTGSVEKKSLTDGLLQF